MFAGFTNKPMLFTEEQVKKATQSPQVAEWN
jgi:hypothetical protein